MNEVIFNIINNLLLIGPLIVLFWLINHSENTYSDSDIKGNILGFLCYLIVWIGYLASFIIGLLLFSTAMLSCHGHKISMSIRIQ